MTLALSGTLPAASSSHCHSVATPKKILEIKPNLSFGSRHLIEMIESVHDSSQSLTVVSSKGCDRCTFMYRYSALRNVLFHTRRRRAVQAANAAPGGRMWRSRRAPRPRLRDAALHSRNQAAACNHSSELGGGPRAWQAMSTASR
jgi:hypothetical protein